MRPLLVSARSWLDSAPKPGHPRALKRSQVKNGETSVRRSTGGCTVGAQLASFGHGTADRVALLDLFVRCRVTRVVDVRRFPNSRHNRDVRHDAFSEWLPAAGIDYRWDERLGGRRTLPKVDGPEPDAWWRVKSFRAYAAHTRTPEFRAALTDLAAGLTDQTDGPADPAEGTVLFMCSESVWWRCHRRLISDAALLLDGIAVRHLGHNGRFTTHEPSAGVRVAEDGLRYDVLDDDRA